MTLRFWEKIEFSVLLAGIVVAGGLWGFVELTEVARDSSARAFDTEILLAFREAGQTDNPIGPLWFEEAMRDITGLGSTIVLVMVTAVTIFYLMLFKVAGAAGESGVMPAMLAAWLPNAIFALAAIGLLARVRT